MTIKEAINQGVIMLKNENIETPKIKSRMIMEHTLKKSKEYIMIYDNKEITREERDLFVKNVKRLILGEPLQYVMGYQEFMKLKFLVNRNVLIPRQDTEILVEEVIKIAEKIENPEILDLCTGSGAIAVSIAKYCKDARITAVDISEKAIEIAKKNAKFNGVLSKIEFIESDMFKKLKKRKFDIIVSNPPYIPTNEILKLSKDVQNEPKLALDGGKTGLDFYEKIAKDGDKYLNNQGFICLEIGYDQKIKVKTILESEHKYVNIRCIKDLCENDRVIICNVL